MTLNELTDVLVWGGKETYYEIPNIVSNIIAENQVYAPYKKVFDKLGESSNFYKNNEEKYRKYMDIRIPPGLSVLILDTLGMIAFYDREINCVKSYSAVHKLYKTSYDWARYIREHDFSKLAELTSEKETALKASEVYMKYGSRILYVTYESTNGSIEWETRFDFLD
jgi:hypothetical protein